MGYKIAIVTTKQPATNPRVVKEANALAQAGYEVTVVYPYMTDWAVPIDREIINKAHWRAMLVGGTPQKDKLTYHWSRIRRKLHASFGKSLHSIERSYCRAYDEILKELIGLRADLYIGHNPGALAVAYRAAESVGAPCGFDAEDYHRGEQDIQSKSSSVIHQLQSGVLPETYVFDRCKSVDRTNPECRLRT